MSDVASKSADQQYALTVRPARADELDEIMAFYEVMIDATTGTDNDPKWVSGLHPSREELLEAIDEGQLLVAIHQSDNAIVAGVIVDQRWNPGYDQGAWQVMADPHRVWTLHLLAVHPAYQHQGIARRFLAAIESFIRAHGGTALRIDVLATNAASLTTYERLGFTRIGPVELHYEDPRVTEFVLFEKAV